MTYTISVRNHRPITVDTVHAANRYAETLKRNGYDVYVIDNTDPAAGTDYAGTVNRNPNRAPYCMKCHRWHN